METRNKERIIGDAKHRDEFNNSMNALRNVMRGNSGYRSDDKSVELKQGRGSKLQIQEDKEKVFGSLNERAHTLVTSKAYRKKL